MPQIQDWIHKLEEGSGIRYLKIIAICLLLVLFVGGYNLRAYRNMSARDAMDAAQVARNVSEGNGFTTRYVRPFSVYLAKRTTKPTPRAPRLKKQPISRDSRKCIPTSPMRRLIRSCWRAG